MTDTPKAIVPATDAMVEAGLMHEHGIEWGRHLTENERHSMRSNMRELLSAAFAASPATKDNVTADNLPIFAEGGLGDRLLSAMEKCAADYVFSPDDDFADHILTDDEKAMLVDFINWTFAQDTVNRILQDAAKAAPKDIMDGWQPASTAPKGTWVRTRLSTEDGENVCMRITHDGYDDEWVERETGVSTVTHHSFAAPDQWMSLASSGGKQ